MRRLFRYAFAAGLAALCALALPAAGQSVKPGEEGALADFLPPEPGRHICYARTYAADHLRQHPKQTVTEIAFRLAYYRHEPDEFYKQGQRNYYFALLAKRRGSSRTLTAMGECGPNGDSIGCGVECDGGGVSVSRKPGDRILVSLGEDGRIRMSEGCDEGDAVDLEAGADDREFLLGRVEDAACPAYEDW
jgi:hypothetical protein